MQPQTVTKPPLSFADASSLVSGFHFCFCTQHDIQWSRKFRIYSRPLKLINFNASLACSYCCSQISFSSFCSHQIFCSFYSTDVDFSESTILAYKLILEFFYNYLTILIALRFCFIIRITNQSVYYLFFCCRCSFFKLFCRAFFNLYLSIIYWLCAN